MSNLINEPVPIHRGVTFGFYARPGYFESEQARREVDRMTELNVEWVCVVATIMQDSACTPYHYRDFNVTPSDLELAEIIEYIHEKGMKVCFRAMIECWDGWGRTQVQFPRDSDTRIPGLSSDCYARWFACMRARTRFYARLAAKLGCEMYCLDSELDHFVHLNQPWREVVEVAREAYDGPVTSVHTHIVDFEKELTNEDHWFRDLDMLGTSFYRPSRGEPGLSVEQRVQFLQPQLELYRRIAKALGKPLQFGECGCPACTGSSAHPGSWRGGERFDPDEQANHLEAIFRCFWDEPWWGGLYWWKWDEQLDRPQYRTDPAGDQGFTLYGKKASQVMNQWYGRTDRR